jgi:hypothetical protein
VPTLVINWIRPCLENSLNIREIMVHIDAKSVVDILNLANDRTVLIHPNSRVKASVVLILVPCEQARMLPSQRRLSPKLLKQI